MTAVTFSGSIPNIAVIRNAVATPYNSSVRFSGDQTPFTYNIQTGTLPTGMVINPVSGAISGTPTVHGRISGLSVRATDTGLNTATSNAFAITVGPYALRFRIDNILKYISYTRTLIEFEVNFQFSDSSTDFMVLGDSSEDNVYYGVFEVRRSGLVRFKNNEDYIEVNLSAFPVDATITLGWRYTAGLVHITQNGVVIASAGALYSRYTPNYIGRSVFEGYLAKGPLLISCKAVWNTSFVEYISWEYSNVNESVVRSNLTGSSYTLTNVTWQAYDIVPEVTNKPLKYWNGSAWVAKPLKYWNGSAWVAKPLKVVT